MSADAEQADMTLSQLTEDARRLAEQVAALTDRLEKERMDAVAGLLVPLAGVDADEAKREFHEIAKAIQATDHEGEFYAVASGKTLAAFVGRFGHAYDVGTPPSTRTVETFWQDPIGCSKKTRRAVLMGVFTAVESAADSADKVGARRLSEAGKDIARWVDSHFMTLARVEEREAEAARRINHALSVAQDMTQVDEASAVCIATYARFIRTGGRDLAVYLDRASNVWDT